MLKTALIFQNHMVLQRGKKITFWGTTDQKEEICICVQGKTAKGFANDQGFWWIEMEPLTASFDETVTMSCQDEELVLTGVQVGDVWLAGGQSNMEFFMRYDEDFEEEKKICTNPNIRFFDYPEVSYPEQINEADYRKNFARWRLAEPEQLEWFSAVGYYFAKEIQASQDIPVGIIGCNWGGTPACAWMDEASIREGGGEVFLEEYAQVLKSLDLEAYEQAFSGNQSPWGSYRVDPFADPFSDMMMYGFGIAEIIEKLMGQKPDLAQMDFSSFAPLIGPKYERRPGGLYESMLSQIAPYGISGFLYYQGETDGDTHPDLYEKVFPAMIACWRRLWKEELPFFFVQLAPFGTWMACSGTPYAIIRQAQQKTADTVANTGMAVISDAGMEFDIHPKKKAPVGLRLALQAENKVYGQDVLCEAPTLISVDCADKEWILHFENSGDGLFLLSKGEAVSSADFCTITGLKIVLNGEELDPAALQVSASGDTVVLRGEELKEGRGSITIGEGGWYVVNLYNSAAIPARPCKLEF